MRAIDERWKEVNARTTDALDSIEHEVEQETEHDGTSPTGPEQGISPAGALVACAFEAPVRFEERDAIFGGDISCPMVLDRDMRSSSVALRVRSGQEVREDSQPHARCPLEDGKRNDTLGGRGVRWPPNTCSFC